MPEQRPQSRLMVLMFTDVVGSVDLRRRVGDQVAAQIIKKHDAIFRKTVSAFPFAEILKDLGDGFLTRFSSASDAVHAALHFQNVLHSEDWSGEKLQARIGLHLGEVSEMEVEETTGKPKLSGLAVDITARVMGLALPGQILMTRAAFDNARQYVREQQSATDDSPAITRKWIAHGRYMFKGAEEPLEVFEVGEVGVGPLQVPPDSEKAKRSVAADQEETLGWRPAVGMDIPERKNWVLDRRLGEGGFGEVWLGEHTQSKARRVFKFCFDADRLRSFKRELMLFRLLRDALGDRNDIAKLHEVQMDHPPFYLESEFTEDGSLVEWSERQGGIDKIPLETRLDIVARTAIAVSAAHSVGVLHKDIKPSNILIYRESDGTVRPRLTDFGIGEITDPSQLAKRNIMVTGMSDSFMTTSGGTTTRVYAPPEVLVGKPFTIQGDVYGIGVLLYQMVVADLERPVAVGWEREIPDPLLRDDIARCVEGHPGERLSSAKELAERLQTLPARRRARTRKQIARASVFASVVLAVLLSISGAWLVRETILRKETQKEAEKALAVAEFLVSMFSVDPRNPGEARDVKVVEKLDSAAAQLDQGRLAEEPEIQAAVRAALGNAYRAGFLFVEAKEQLAKSLETRRALSKSPRDVSQTLEDFGAVHWWLEDYATAQKLFEESLVIRRAAFGEESIEVASSLNYLAANYDRQRQHTEAEELYKLALAIRERLPSNHPQRVDLVARSKNNLATCYRAQQRFDEALRYFREATDMIRDKYGKNYIDVANGLGNIAGVHFMRGNLTEAERTHSEALAIKKGVYKDEPNIALAVTYSGLGQVYFAQNRFDDAEQAHRQALELRRQYPNGHTDISNSLDSLGETLMAKKQFADAEPVLKEAVENRKLAQNQRPLDIADAQGRLAICLVKLNRNDDAEALLKESFDVIAAAQDASATLKKRATDRLADFYEQSGRSELASSLRQNGTLPDQTPNAP